MDSYRANLDQPPKGTSYLVLTSIFLILSAIGLFLLFIFLPNRPKPPQTQPISDVITQIPTEIIQPSEIPLIISPTITTKPTLTPEPTALPTKAVATVGTPSATFVDYQSVSDNFSVTYSSSRQIYQDTEFSGNRYTFYNSKGSIAIHAGFQWSWTHPDRAFTNNLLVDGHNTFRYDIDSQTLIDLQDKSKNYTIQCIHNGLTTLKTECDQLIKSFKFLKL
jgi:hypothetical protein